MNRFPTGEAKRAVIDVSNAAPIRNVQRVALDYTINYVFEFEIDHLVTYPEFLELVQKAVLGMREQMIPHIKSYPESIAQELVKRGLLDKQSFQAFANKQVNE